MAKVPPKSAAKSGTSRPGRAPVDEGKRFKREVVLPHASDESRSRLAEATDELVSAFPANANTPFEFGDENARAPRAGVTRDPSDPAVAASTGSESNPTAKTDAPAAPGQAPSVGPLSSVRADATGQPLTSNQGVLVSDNQHSLKAGLRGPTLLEDFLLREKLTHFDHERIPERIVHARGSAAHGVFESHLARQPARRFRSSGGEPRPGGLRAELAGGGCPCLSGARGKHNHFVRESDPPEV